MKMQTRRTATALLLCLSAALPAVGQQEKLIAIDVLLEPDQTMVARANAINARLRADYPKGYALDATHAPHVTMLQCFVREKDFDAVTGAVMKVLSKERFGELQLKATGLISGPWDGVALHAILVERSPQLMRLQQKVADALAPFSVSGGTAAAFIDTPPNADIVGYVADFAPKSSGANYMPHVTVGASTEAFAKKLKAEPFETFSFRPTDAAIYQLGNFGTAAKELWRSPAVSPLGSWNDGAAKKAILGFVQRVTTEVGPDFVPVAERIAVFDNDGTLWSEQPIYFQVQFAFDRIRALLPQHPEWKTTQPFKALLENDMKTLAAAGEAGIMEMGLATHAGMTTEEFDRIVKDWLATARHPKFNRPYTDLAYQPMLELLDFLRANGFKTYIVSGGGVEFVRTFSEKIYGIPPEQVVGSSIETKFEIREGKPVLVRLPKVDFIDDREGKPVGIQKFIGRRPIAAFGNSDGDFAMLQWATAGAGPRFGLLVHHDDAEREFAYDRKSFVGQLDKGLDEAPKRGWTVVSMKSDWNCVFNWSR
jgi:phosphoserine phosphatase